MEEEKRGFRVPEDNTADKKKMAYLFVITFVVVVFLVSLFLKCVSPNTDLDIGENSSQIEQSDNDVNSHIDQRLRMIQNDDDMPGVSGKNGLETPEELANRLKNDNEVSQKEQEKADKKALDAANEHKIEPVQLETQDPATQTPTYSKIYIGQYTSMQDAVAMQSMVMNSGLVDAPQIKSVNGYYTIQAGVFQNYESAKALANKLNNAGFAAKIVKN